MLKSELQVGDPVVVAAVFYDKHAHMVGKVGTIERVYKTKDYTIVRLAEGGTWHATPCNLERHKGDRL